MTECPTHWAIASDSSFEWVTESGCTIASGFGSGCWSASDLTSVFDLDFVFASGLV